MSAAQTSGNIAKCACGAAKLQLAAPPTNVINCHCGQCRSFTGSAFTTWASYPIGVVTVIGGEHLVQHSTPNGIRHFCKQCGTHLYAQDRRYESILGILAGTITAVIPSPTAHYFVSHKASWHTIRDELPQFGGESGFESLPLADADSA